MGRAGCRSPRQWLTLFGREPKRPPGASWRQAIGRPCTRSRIGSPGPLLSFGVQARHTWIPGQGTHRTAVIREDEHLIFVTRRSTSSQVRNRGLIVVARGRSGGRDGRWTAKHGLTGTYTEVYSVAGAANGTVQDFQQAPAGVFPFPTEHGKWSFLFQAQTGFSSQWVEKGSTA